MRQGRHGVRDVVMPRRRFALGLLTFPAGLLLAFGIWVESFGALGASSESGGPKPSGVRCGT